MISLFCNSRNRTAAMYSPAYSFLIVEGRANFFLHLRQPFDMADECDERAYEKKIGKQNLENSENKIIQHFSLVCSSFCFSV